MYIKKNYNLNNIVLAYYLSSVDLLNIFANEHILSLSSNLVISFDNLHRNNVRFY